MPYENKFSYNDWLISVNGKGVVIFGNGFARIVIIFGVDNNSSSHTDNRKKLGEWPTKGVNDTAGAAEKN